jgi:hypothetical protein
MAWAMYVHQFNAVAGHSNWAVWEKATHLLTVLQGQTTSVIHSILAELTSTAETTSWLQCIVPS